MENNYIVRRTGIPSVDSYQKLSADLKELFGGFKGVSFEEIAAHEDDEGEMIPESLMIYLDSRKYQFLKLEKAENVYFKLSFHCGPGTTKGENWIDLESSSKNATVSYNFVKTSFGAVFSIFPFIYDSRSCISDGYLQCFFTTFENDDGDELNGFVYCASSLESSENEKSYISTEVHEKLEYFIADDCFMGGKGDRTVMINAVSYTHPVMSRHLYKKLQSEQEKFGVVRINGKTYVSGSHFCLEGKDD